MTNEINNTFTANRSSLFQNYKSSSEDNLNYLIVPNSYQLKDNKLFLAKEILVVNKNSLLKSQSYPFFFILQEMYLETIKPAKQSFD